MKSHQNEFSTRDVLALIAAPMAVAAVCAALVHGAAHAGALPPPRPALDADCAILTHQIDAARGQSAEIVLIGDSSCLMDVSARQLSGALKTSVLNLGTLSYLDLAAYGALLREHQRRHTPKLVVLLMHPEGLRRLNSEAYQLAVFENYLHGRDHSSTDTPAAAFNAWSGTDLVNGRLLARLIPIPLRGDYGVYYGFTSDLEKFMSAKSGSVVDPGHESFKGSAEYRLAPTLQKASQAFRAAIPQIKLAVGITPVPAGFARSGFAEQRESMLRQWMEWLNTTNGLATIPATLPNDQFARVTHLKPEAVPNFTAALAEALRGLIP